MAKLEVLTGFGERIDQSLTKNAHRSLEQQVQFSDTYQSDIHRAVSILKEAGCTRVFLFGALTAAGVGGKSDIVLAVRGCPKGKFFHLLGRLLMELERPVDLVDLDVRHAFARYLEEQGDLLQVG